MVDFNSQIFNLFSRRFNNYNLNHAILADYFADLNQTIVLVNRLFVYPFLINELPLYSVIQNVTTTRITPASARSSHSVDRFLSAETKTLIHKMATCRILKANGNAIKRLNKIFWKFKFPVSIKPFLPWHYRYKTITFKTIGEDHELAFVLINNVSSD